ncbi:hypothetical protein [Oceanospirillum sanctuarii]|nr:hypothetical protein [Oceanospirillum sanctuarii]
MVLSSGFPFLFIPAALWCRIIQGVTHTLKAFPTLQSFFAGLSQKLP